MTVAAWINAEALDKPWQAIVTKGEGACRLQRNNETNTLEFACTGLHVPNGNDYGSLFGTKEITLNEWHHIAGVYNGKKMYLYVDGPWMPPRKPGARSIRMTCACSSGGTPRWGTVSGTA